MICKFTSCSDSVCHCGSEVVSEKFLQIRNQGQGPYCGIGGGVKGLYCGLNYVLKTN